MDKIIKQILSESIKVKNKILDDPSLLDQIGKISSVIIEAYKRKNKVILFGNGGSAADAQHVAGELVNKFQLEREALPAIALTTDSSVLTSIANDYDYSRIFARQVEAWAKEGDVVIGISTSGNSANVMEAVKVAKEKGAKTIGFTGRSGGKLAKLVDLAVRVPSDETPRIQESHITILHIICYLVERGLFGSQSRA
ncbi:phosphoheptose isomerase [Candidatus Aerophobetes bacterium Ae_b3b]|nr:MAG: phosphoheptose isomerase [Candidatus Aerophobetes bacterium Ae_b3b]